MMETLLSISGEADNVPCFYSKFVLCEEGQNMRYGDWLRVFPWTKIGLESKILSINEENVSFLIFQKPESSLSH